MRGRWSRIPIKKIYIKRSRKRGCEHKCLRGVLKRRNKPRILGKISFFYFLYYIHNLLTKVTSTNVNIIKTHIDMLMSTICACGAIIPSFFRHFLLILAFAFRAYICFIKLWFFLVFSKLTCIMLICITIVAWTNYAHSFRRFTITMTIEGGYISVVCITFIHRLSFFIHSFINQYFHAINHLHLSPFGCTCNLSGIFLLLWLAFAPAPGLCDKDEPFFILCTWLYSVDLVLPSHRICTT